MFLDGFRVLGLKGFWFRVEAFEVFFGWLQGFTPKSFWKTWFRNAES